MGTSRKKCYYQSSLLKRFTLFELRSTEGWSIYLENTHPPNSQYGGLIIKLDTAVVQIYFSGVQCISLVRVKTSPCIFELEPWVPIPDV